MTTFTFANNISTTLAGAVSNSATTITLASTANLPSSIPAGQVLVITLNDSATRQNFEIVYATAIAGATLTVMRAQEGTAALAWLTGDFAYSPPTAGQQASFGQISASNTWTGANSFSSPVAAVPAVIGSTTEVVNQGQFGSLLSVTGYKKYPDPSSPTGYYIEQWGTISSSNNTGVTFPIAFPNACLNVVLSESAGSSSSWGIGNPTVHGSSNWSANGFVHWTLSFANGNWFNASNTCSYRATGY